MQDSHPLALEVTVVGSVELAKVEVMVRAVELGRAEASAAGSSS